MFINIRYLAITLIAVFIALGIGILIGFQLDSNDLILIQQHELIESLEETFEELTETNQALETKIKNLTQDLQRSQTFMEAIAGDYLHQRLLGQNIALVKTSSGLDYSPLTNILDSAGATITGSVTIADSIPSQEQSEKAGQSNPPLYTLIAAAIVDGDLNTLADLKQQNLVEAEGAFSVPPDFVIIAGGSRTPTDRPELIDIPLIKEFKQRNIPVVGVESTEADYSYMDYYKKERISTVDNVDTIIGQTSLVLIMAGQEGNFGVKASAATLIPLTRKEQQ
ncbi:MAG: copper transporter [Firmicutes bacterium]|nr:copper transporter [Bacillota bacterium]